MSGSFPGLKRLYNALAGKIRDKGENPTQRRIMRSRGYVTNMHTGITSHDHRPNQMLEWMVARRNIDGSWRIFMESGVTSGRKQNKIVMGHKRTIATDADFAVAAETIRNYETRMAQNHSQFTAMKPTCDHVSFVAPAAEKPRKQSVPKP